MIIDQDDLNRAVTATYDGAGREVDRALPIVTGFTHSNHTTKSYDANGNVTDVYKHDWGQNQGAGPEIEDVLHTQTVYDVLDRATETLEQPENETFKTTQTFTYSSLGHKTWEWNRNAIGTQHLYDTQGLEWKTQAGYLTGLTGTGAMVGEGNPDGYVLIQREFDRDGKVTRQVDDAGKATATDVDGAGRQLTITYQDSSYESITYFRDNTIDVEYRYAKDPGNPEVYHAQYDYDTAKRKTKATFTVVSSGLLGVYEELFEYDGASRVTKGTAKSKAYTPSSSTEYYTITVKAYDSLDNVRDDQQILERHDGAGPTQIYSQTVTRNVDGLGNRTQVTVPEYDRVYTFDELNRIKEIKQGTLSLISSSWVGAGHRVGRITYGNGAFCDVGSAGYDPLRRPIDILHYRTDQKPSNSWSAEFQYAYDKEGNRLSEKKVHDTGHSQTFAYDGGNRIRTFNQWNGVDPQTQTLLEDYNLDGVGNWRKHTIGGTEHTNTVSDLHEYQTQFDNSTTVTYDARGNLTRWSDRELKYDVRGRVVGARNTTTNAKYNYVYDAEGRRVLAGSKYFIYELEREIKQDTYPTQSPTLFVTYGTEPDEILVIERDGSRFYVHRDALGSTVAVSRNSNGLLSDRIDYTPYGVPTITSYNGGSSTPYLFAGRRRDSETGLYHMRARSYVPEMGRFASRDPIGLWGDVNNWGNPYTYGGSTPLRRIDPEGLAGSDTDTIRFRLNVPGIGIPPPEAPTRRETPFSDKVWANLVAGLGDGGLPALTLGLIPPIGPIYPDAPGYQEGLGQGASAMTAAIIQAMCADYAAFNNAITAGLQNEANQALARVTLEASAIRPSSAPLSRSTASGTQVAKENHWARPETLDAHFSNHGAGVAAKTPGEYAKMAQDFLKNGTKEGLPIKIDKDGTIRVYDPKTGKFGAYTPKGETKTFFRPDNPKEFWKSQPGKPFKLKVGATAGSDKHD
ncbi:MAG: RHS repeat-associated core domain-containing protein [Planctomycetota bacterium]